MESTENIECKESLQPESWDFVMNGNNRQAPAPSFRELYGPKQSSVPWEEQQVDIVRFWTDSGDCWGIAVKFRLFPTSSKCITTPIRGLFLVCRQAALESSTANLSSGSEIFLISAGAITTVFASENCLHRSRPAPT